MGATLSELAYLFRASRQSRPLLLLGAGASFRSGIPLANDLVSRIARAAYARQVKGQDERFCHPAPSDWLPFLQNQPWFISDAKRYAENFPLAVEHLLHPREFRREFLTDAIQPSNGINDGYRALANLVMRRLCWTVLTTNFDHLIVDALRERRPHIPDVVEVNRTEDDLVRFNIFNRCQVVYLHGAVEYYRDKNLVNETERLDDGVVQLIRPLLSYSPLVVMGYRGAEPSITAHLLGEGIDRCHGYPNGIYWCVRRGETPHENVIQLGSRIGSNLRIAEIDGFDEAIGALDRELEGEAWFSGADDPRPIVSSKRSADQPFDRQLMEDVTVDDLDQDLVLATLTDYCKRLKLPAVDQHSYLSLMKEQGLVVVTNGAATPTKGCYLLFGREVSERFPFAKVAFTRGNRKRVVFEGSLIGQFMKLVDHLTSDEINPTLRVKGERSSEEQAAYPNRALVELAVNMLVHRDYEAEMHSTIDFEPGSFLRFTNPGGLMPKVLNSVQVDKGGRFQPVRSTTEIRNTTLADIFWGLGPMDKAGSGLADVQEMMTEYGGRSEFSISSDNLDVRAILFQPRQAAPEKRVARRVVPSELYITNLLPFRVVPQTISILPLPEKPLGDAPLFNRDESPDDLPIFICHGGRLHTFADLRLLRDFSERRGYFDQLEVKCINDYLLDENSRRLFVWLLGKHWSFFLKRWGAQGLFVDHYRRKRAFFQLVKGERNTIIYDSRSRKGVKRDVVKQRIHGKQIEYENEGFYYSIEQYNDFWAVQLKPFYMFTVVDGKTPLPSFLIGRRATSRMKFDRNKNVDDDLTFWARFLSGGQPTINIGGVGVDNLLVDSEFASAEVPMLAREVAAGENSD
jgi:hypothetical protein